MACRALDRTAIIYLAGVCVHVCMFLCTLGEEERQLILLNYRLFASLTPPGMLILAGVFTLVLIASHC